MAVEEKQGISRLEQLVEEISEVERAKELRREQKQRTMNWKQRKTAINEEVLEKEEVCVNENVEETEEINGHGDSCEDDEDDGGSGGSPCSCEDLSNCERSKSKISGFLNGDCGYVSFPGYQTQLFKGCQTPSKG